MTPFLPIVALVRRELVTTLRWRGTSIAFLVLAACFGLAVFSAWPVQNVVLGALAGEAMGLLFAFLVLLLGAAVVVMPGLGASSIVSERDADTFEQVYLTLLRPWQIVAAKLAGATAVYVLFVIGMLPAIGTVMFLVGLDRGQVLRPMALLFLASLTCAAIGMASAAVFRHTMRALVGSYVLLIVYMGVPFFILLGVAAMFGLDSQAERFATSLIPVVPLGAILINAYGIDPFGGMKAPPFLYGCLYSLVTLVLCMVAVWLRMRGRSLLQPSETVPRRWRRQRRPRQPLDRQHHCPDGLNPILARELILSRSWRPGHWLWRALPIFVLTLWLNIHLFILSDWTGYRNPYAESVRTSLLTMIVTATFLAPAFGANAITRERERGNLDFLRSTLLTPRQIVRGKAMAAFAAGCPFLVGGLLGTAPMLLMVRSGYLIHIGAGVLTLILCSFLAVCMGTLASTICRRTGPAVVLTYTLSAIAFYGMALLILLLLSPWQFVLSWQLIEWSTQWASPVMGYTYATETAYTYPPQSPLPNHFRLAYWLFSSAFAVALCTAALSLARRILARQWRRE